VDQRSCKPSPDALRACPSRLPGKRARPVPRGRRRSNAPPLPDWKPVFFLLESQGLDCQLYNAGQVKALPGRPKTDRAEPGLARQDHRAGDDRLQLRAARAYPPPAHSHPLPPSPDPGPHR
jgi:hypothetical protein